MKSMIDIFKKELQDGMEIVKCKEMANVYKITLSYDGMTGTCELSKMCAPNAEKSLCRKSIDTAISGMYINAGNLAEELGGGGHTGAAGCNLDYLRFKKN